VLSELAHIYEDARRSPFLRSQDPEAEIEGTQAEIRGRRDVRAIEELYRSHGGRMKSVARNLLGNASDAEDAVQEAFLRLYRSLPVFKGEARLSTLLYRILVNACFDTGRKRSRRGEMQDVTPECSPSAVPDPALRMTIDRGLQTLPEPQRSVFLLCEVEGFTHREVGEILGIPEGTSKHALFLARKALQALVLGLRRRRSES
jgi:RNA polymerase sigma-70 factor (ECF subfamily)